MENICAAHHCSNVIRGRRSGAKFCSNACKTEQSRHNKRNGIVQGSIKSSVPISGSPVNDMALSAFNAGMRNAISDKSLGNGVGANVVGAAAPYLGDCVKKRPLLSLAVAFGGYKLAKIFFRSCKTTTQGTKQVKECTEANGVHKAGGATAALLGINYLCDNWTEIAKKLPIVTDVKRNSNVTVTERNVTQQHFKQPFIQDLFKDVKLN